jgi:hypothetical protein
MLVDDIVQEPTRPAPIVMLIGGAATAPSPVALPAEHDIYHSTRPATGGNAAWPTWVMRQR